MRDKVCVGHSSLLDIVVQSMGPGVTQERKGLGGSLVMEEFVSHGTCFHHHWTPKLASFWSSWTGIHISLFFLFKILNPFSVLKTMARQKYPEIRAEEAYILVLGC